MDENQAHLVQQWLIKARHELVSLLVDCEQLDPAFSVLAEATEVLTPFATAFHYPGDGLDPEPADVAEAIKLAETVLAFVLTRIPEGGS